ncbi:OmpH family outer membrane protein [Thiotrichales bacterium 19S9-12]|nr:OmpH family outer membrane protein [Thiotrichales bacterium 19S9-11]MCF6812182.1 OmpH family outer membrane protein [Thiotrichales bacterium 19S9-12]
MKLVTKILAASILTGSLMTAGFANDDAMKIGVVDAAKVYQQVPQGMATADQVRNTLKPEVEKLSKEQQTLADEAKQLEKDRTSLSESDYDNKKAELAAKMQTFQQKYMQIRQQDTQKSQQLAQSFEKAFAESVSEIGKKEGYDMILVKQAAPYAKNQYDITSEVISNMEAEHTTVASK